MGHGSIQQEHFHSFVRCLATNDNRGEALTRAVILALLGMEAQMRSGLGPQAGASRIRRPHDMALLKPADAAGSCHMIHVDVLRGGRVASRHWRVIAATDADGLTLSPAALDVLADARFDAPALPALGQVGPLFIHELVDFPAPQPGWFTTTKERITLYRRLYNLKRWTAMNRLAELVKLHALRMRPSPRRWMTITRASSQGESPSWARGGGPRPSTTLVATRWQHRSPSNPRSMTRTS
jgi:hypothetical protein